MRIGKPQSKRTPVRLRHKIQKASAAKQRKNRKDAKKNPQWRSRLKKDPGIPNLFPFKAKMLAEIEETKRRKEEEQQQRREIAKAQRQGVTVQAKAQESAQEMEDELLDDEDESDDGDEMDVQDDANPMAALLASAQARAQTFTADGDEEDDYDEDASEGDEDEEEWDGIQSHEPRQKTSQEPRAKTLPKQALKDPIRSVTLLLERMRDTQNGIQIMLDHYQIPALVTSGADFPTRFLVEVARKTGRLGKGGIPNLHSAGLTVLSDLNEERLVLPASVSTQVQKQPKGVNTGDVLVVSQMSQPFRLDGLWENNGVAEEVHGSKMAVEA